MPLSKTAPKPRINSDTGCRQGRPPKDRTAVKQLREQLSGQRDPSLTHENPKLRPATVWRTIRIAEATYAAIKTMQGRLQTIKGENVAIDTVVAQSLITAAPALLRDAREEG